MKLRVILFVLMTSMFGVSFAAKPYKSRTSERYGLQQHELQQLLDTPAKLQPKPVVFVEWQKIEAGWLGWNNDNATPIKKYATICKVANSIANKLGACAVISCKDMLLGITPDQREVVDPAYDITQRVIDQLNKEYLARK